MSRSTGHSIRIEPYKVVRLSGGCQVIRVIDGTAWITAEQKDIVAGPSREVMVEGSEELPVVISGMMGEGVTLNIGNMIALAA